MDQFLQEMAKKFNLYVFTRAEKYYAEGILELIDTHNLIKGLWNREHLILKDGKFYKDLTLIEKNE